MAVKLRLTRKGKKKQPFYRIVAADSRSRRDGKYIEKIGYYNPITNPAEVVIDEEKVFYWLKNGAIPTDTVENLFSKKGIMLKWHHIKQGHDDAKVEEEYKKWELLQLERQKREEALAAQAKREQEPEVTEEEPASETGEEQVAPEAKPDAPPEVEPEVEAKPEAPPEVEPEVETKPEAPSEVEPGVEAKPVEEEVVEIQPAEETPEPPVSEAQPDEEPKSESQQADETDESKK